MPGQGGRPWVAYVGPFPYPGGAAASRRVLGVAESLSLAGFDVVIASGAGDSPQDAGKLVGQGERIAWCHLPERVAEHWPRPLRRFRYALMGGRTVEWLASQSTLPAAVILYSGYTPYLQRLLPWCRRNRVRLLFDAVEWYEPEHASGYLTSPYQWNIEWAMRRLLPRTDGVIAISKYLADYYRGRGVPVTAVGVAQLDARVHRHHVRRHLARRHDRTTVEHRLDRRTVRQGAGAARVAAQQARQTGMVEFGERTLQSQGFHGHSFLRSQRRAGCGRTPSRGLVRPGDLRCAQSGWGDRRA